MIHFAHGGNAAELPMELAANAAFVAGRVNQQRPISWLLDASSPSTSLDPSAAQEAGAGSGAQAVVVFPGLEFSAPRLDAKPLDSLGAWYGLEVRGVLGDDLLAHLVAEIDYARLSIELYDPQAFHSAGHHGKLDVRWLDGLPTVHAKLRLAGKTVDGDFALNTAGSAGIVVTQKFLAAHRMYPFAGKTNPSGVIDASGESLLPTARGEWLELGSNQISQPLVAIAPTGNWSALAGWIGGEILRKFSLILDFPENRVFLEPNRYLIFPIAADASGVTVVAAGAGLTEFEIHDVLAGSPAAEGGLLPGDQILAIDAESASDLNLDQIRDMLSESGHTSVLVIRRLGRELKLQIHLESPLAPDYKEPNPGEK
jgi:hypothetical protein